MQTPQKWPNWVFGKKDAQCSETYEIQFSDFDDFHVLRNGRFCSKNSKKINHNMTIYNHNVNDHNLTTKLVLLAIRSICVSEDSKKMKKNALIFFSKSEKKNSRKKSETNFMCPKTPIRGGLLLQALDAFKLNPCSQLVIGYHWLVLLNQARQNLQASEN